MQSLSVPSGKVSGAPDDAEVGGGNPPMSSSTRFPSPRPAPTPRTSPQTVPSRRSLTHNRLALNSLLVVTAVTATLTLPRARAQDGPNPLPTGKSLSLPPTQTTRQGVGSLPMNLIPTADGRFAISTDMGFRQSLWVTRVSDGVGVADVEFSNAAPNPDTNGLYYGLAIRPDGTLFAAQGSNDSIAVLSLNTTTGELTTVKSTIKTKKGDFPSGLALDDRGYLYVANNDPGTFAQPSSVAVYDTAAGAEVGRYTFSGPTNFPLAVAALRDGRKVYVTSQRDGVIYVFNTADPKKPALVNTIPTGSHPIGLLLNKAQDRLFVANAHSDTVSVLDTSSDTVLANVSVRPTRPRKQTGVTPTGLALSPDEGTLYVTLGDFNAVAVISLSNPANPLVRGYVPAGWYPTGVVVSPDGSRLLVTDAKGLRTRYPNPGYLQVNYNDSPAYDLNLIEGEVNTLPVPADDAALQGTTAQVLANNAPRLGATNYDKIGLKAGGITHVIYIVKENRTYDQMLGDIGKGNGEPSLAIFGQEITPNQHKLARRFVLLDNFYVCAEASGDGWPWSTQGIANESVIKNLPYNYSNRGRQYDFEGQNNGYLVGGFPANDPDGKPLSAVFPNGAPAIPDVSEGPGGHIWDAVLKAGLSYRNYGFFYSFGVTQQGAVVLPDNYPAAAGLLPPGHDLAGTSDTDFRRYDNDFPDSDAPTALGFSYSLKTYGKYNAPSRFSEWNREFQQMLAKDPTGGAVPAMMTVRFNHDHTQGFTPGKFSPRAEVADNDYAVGQLVEAVSNSAIWPHTAIFIVEDDAQDGPDHVDAHRSPCFVISPYVTAQSVDHTFYNTDSVLRSMELILGIPALSQYDRIAQPITFGDTPANVGPYKAIIPAASIIGEKNPTLAELTKHDDPRQELARASLEMNFELPDSAPPRRLNEILWQTVRGVDSPMPAPRHTIVASRPALSLTPPKAAPGADDDDG